MLVARQRGRERASRAEHSVDGEQRFHAHKPYRFIEHSASRPPRPDATLTCDLRPTAPNERRTYLRSPFPGGGDVALDVFKERGVPIEKQGFDWRELVQTPISKLDDDAFTRVRVILMNGIEARRCASCTRARALNGALRLPLARIRRIEQHQQTLVNWLTPPDQSPLETTIGYEQVAIEVTASVAQQRARSVPRAGVPLRPARGLRSPVPLRGADGSRRGQGRQQHPPELHRHPPGPAHVASSTARRRTICASPYDRTTRGPAHQAQRAHPRRRPSTRRTTTT